MSVPVHCLTVPRVSVDRLGDLHVLLARSAVRLAAAGPDPAAMLPSVSQAIHAGLDESTRTELAARMLPEL